MKINGLSLTIGIIVGAGIGVLSARSYFKTKYETIADEEIASMKKYYEGKHIKEQLKVMEKLESEKNMADIAKESLSVSLDDVKEEMESDDIPEYGKMFKNQEFVKEPYIIGPDEFFDERDDFEKISLSYYARDHILADDNECMLEDVESAVGHDWETRFGEYVTGIVYVRNEFRHCDYEIMELDASFTDFKD